MVFMTQIGFAQDKAATEDLTVTITLSEAEAMKAKSLKGLEHGKLSKGLDKYTFEITTAQEELGSLKNELKTMFPTCNIEVAKRNN